MVMQIILFIVIAYLIGSISPALLVGKIFYNTDIRTMGSGNLGTTNTFRCLGKKAGAQRFPQNGWKSFAECKGIREFQI